MCDECGHFFCPSNCVNYKDYSPQRGRITLRCGECGSGICPGENYYEIRGEIYCPDCIENMDMPDFASACGFAGIRELLSFIGFPCLTAQDCWG